MMCKINTGYKKLFAVLVFAWKSLNNSGFKGRPVNWKSELLYDLIQLGEGLLPFICSYIAVWKIESKEQGEIGLAMHFVHWSSNLCLTQSLS